MSYYIHSFVPNISVANISTNYFTSVYVPMAFQSEAVRDAIMACASAHLAKVATDEDRKTHLLSLSAKHQSYCHKFLHDRISLAGNLQSDSLEAITIILLLVGLEVQNGAHTPTWVNQLNCVRTIVRQYGGRGAFCRSSWEAECLYQHFLYHDVMSLIMQGVTRQTVENDGDAADEVLGLSPGIPASAELPWEKYLRADCAVSQSPEATPTPNHSDIAHPLLGLSTNLFFLMQKIRQVKFIEQSVDLYTSPNNDLFLDLEREFSNMRFDLYPPSDSSSSGQLDMGTRLDLLTLAETYKFAALIMLYRRSAMHLHQLPVLARHIISLVERIPPGNAAESGLTYPLFLAGAELTAEDDIMRCATKLISIRKRVNVMNIQSAETVLEEVWRERLNGGVPKDWEHILQEWQWVINLG